MSAEDAPPEPRPTTRREEPFERVAGSRAERHEPEHETLAVAEGRPTMYVMVGLPAAGKTTVARRIEIDRRALRFTPDEWMIPLFGESMANGRRNVLEGRFIATAMSALRLGFNVVLDFGVWAKDERTALRWLASMAGASCTLVYLPISADEEELTGRSWDAPPSGFDSWLAWIAVWWPTSLG